MGEKWAQWGPAAAPVVRVYPVLGRHRVRGQRGEWEWGPRGPWCHTEDVGKHFRSTEWPREVLSRRATWPDLCIRKGQPAPGAGLDWRGRHRGREIWREAGPVPGVGEWL